jgi:hypothetical protein
MSRKNLGIYEIRVLLEEDAIRKLEDGQPVEIGGLSFGQPIMITLKRSEKTSRAFKVETTSEDPAGHVPQSRNGAELTAKA